MIKEVNLNELSQDQLVALVIQFDEERNVMTDVNNGLLSRVAALPDLSANVAALVNEWATVCNQVTSASAEEMQKIVQIHAPTLAN